jgi:hypothetical protein
MSTLTRKGYGRIYVANPEDVQKVKDIIREMDEFEFDYLPAGLVAPFSHYPTLHYTHKFCDLDMNALTAICWSRGIFIWVCDNLNQDFMPNAIEALAEAAAARKP